MEVISYSEIRANLASAMRRVTRGKDMIVITRRGHSPVVMLPLEAVQGVFDETAYLTASAANRKALDASIAQIKGGETVPAKLRKGRPVKA